MKPATDQYAEPQKDRGISRMVIVSAVLHVVGIALILASTKHYHGESSPSPPASYSVELVSPAALAKRGSGGGEEKVAPTSALPAEGEKIEAAQAKVAPNTVPIIKPAEEPKREEPLKLRAKESPIVKPKEVTKAIETPKPQEPPVAKATVPTKVVAAVKVVPKEPPAEKRKEELKPVEAAKPKEVVTLPEKKQKPKEPLQVKPEQEHVKLTEKKPEPKKPETKPEPANVPAKESGKRVLKSDENQVETAKTPTKAPLAKATPRKAAEDTDAQEREKKILAAVESVRAREEAASRDQDITSAVERIRRNAAEKGDENASGKTENPRSFHQREEAKENGGGKAHGLEFITYTENIKQRVKESWILPERRPGLTAIIRFAVEADGQVVDVELVEPSGDRAFDQSAIRAVKKANPLPPPPSAYREEFTTQKVEITFSGEERIN